MQRPVRLLMIGPLPPPRGGATVSFQHLIAELQTQAGVEVQCLNSKRAESRLGKLLTLLRLSAAMTRLIPRCDVVSLHASPAGYVVLGALTRLLCRAFRKPFVARLFGSGILDVYTRASAAARALIRRSLRADRLLLQTRSLVEFFRHELPGVDIQWFPTSRPRRPRPRSRSPGRPARLLLAGHVRESKGVGVALDALASIRAPVELHVFGRAEDESLIDRIHATPNAFFHGEVRSDQLVDVMHTYDLLIVPTYYDGEGYPGIIVEAFSVGLPVVATDWKCIPEVVEDGRNGLLVPVKDAWALAGAIDGLVTDEAGYRRLSAHAYQTSLAFDSHYWNGPRFLELAAPSPALERAPSHHGKDL